MEQDFYKARLQNHGIEVQMKPVAKQYIALFMTNYDN